VNREGPAVSSQEVWDGLHASGVPLVSVIIRMNMTRNDGIKQVKWGPWGHGENRRHAITTDTPSSTLSSPPSREKKETELSFLDTTIAIYIISRQYSIVVTAVTLQQHQQEHH
jgi:hypothetical protein